MSPKLIRAGIEPSTAARPRRPEARPQRRQTLARISDAAGRLEHPAALCNELVMVVKETSLASTFFLGDLMTTYRKINGAI
jgi:hypothetical protein